MDWKKSITKLRKWYVSKLFDKNIFQSQMLVAEPATNMPRRVDEIGIVMWHVNSDLALTSVKFNNNRSAKTVQLQKATLTFVNVYLLLRATVLKDFSYSLKKMFKLFLTAI
jgi:hypothetical protein